MTTCPSLFAAHDAGLIALPADIVQLREARDRAEEHLRELTAPAHPLSVRDDITAETVEAFIAGKPVPDLSAVAAAEAATASFSHQLEVYRVALAALEQRIAGATAAAADELVAAVLRPPFEATVTALRDAHVLLEPFETAGRGALALAAQKVRTAASTVDVQTGTYTALRAAAAEVRSLTETPTHDVDGEFAAFTDIHTVWPRQRRTNFGAVPPPWDAAPDKLAWQIRHLTPWLPTVAEQDQRWLEVYGEAAKAQRVAREKGQAMSLTFGQGH